MNRLYASGIMFLLCFLFSSVWSEECTCLGLKNDQEEKRGEDCKSKYCYVNKEDCRKEGFEVIESYSKATALTQVNDKVGFSRTFCKSPDEKKHLTKFCRCLGKKDENNQGKNCVSSKFCYVNMVACFPYDINVSESDSKLNYESEHVGDTNVIGLSHNICGDSKGTFRMKRRCECNPDDEASCKVQNKADCETEGITQFEGDRSDEMQKIREERKRLNQCRCLGNSSCNDKYKKGAVPFCIVNNAICTREGFIVTPFMEHVFENDNALLSTGKSLGESMSQLGLSQDFCKIKKNRYAKNELQVQRIQWVSIGTIPMGHKRIERTREKISESRTTMRENQENREIADADSHSSTNNWKIGLEAEASGNCFVGKYSVKATAEYGGQNTRSTDHREVINQINKTMNTRIRTQELEKQFEETVEADNKNNRTIYLLQISGTDSNGNIIIEQLPNTKVVRIENEKPSERFALELLGLHHHLDLVEENGKVFEEKAKNNSERKNCIDKINCIIV